MNGKFYVALPVAGCLLVAGLWPGASTNPADVPAREALPGTAIPAQYRLEAAGFRVVGAFKDARLSDVMYRGADGARITVSSAVVDADFPTRDQAARHAPRVTIQGSPGYVTDTTGRAFNVVSWTPAQGVLVSVAGDHATTAQLVVLAAQVVKA